MAKKRFLAILLSVFMLIQAMPMNALAAGVVRSNTLSGETYHTVDFVVGDDTVATQLVESDAALETLPEDPTLVEHEFTGWKAGETEVTVGTKVNSDLTAEAQFAPLPKYVVTVKYVYTGTDTEVADSVKREYTKYDAVDTIASPTSAAMEIDGGLELVYPVDSVVTINPAELTADTVIRVEYTLPNVEYTVEHRVVGTEEVIETETLTANNGAIILPEAKTFENYEFASTTQMVLDKDDAASLKGVVYYNPKEYKLNYNSMGGSYVDAKYADYGSDVNVYTSSTGRACGLEEHTHTSGCYTSSFWGGQTLNCKITEHTHSSACNATVYDPAPTRTGYTFAGWYLDEACTQAAPTTMTIEGETTVYAKWEGKTVNYTIVYQKEVWNNTTGKGEYTFAESATRQAKVGETVTATDDKNYTYYNPTPAECTSATVAADGSTVVYAKYPLQEYTFVFNLDSNSATLTINGKTYNNSDNKYSFVVRLGEDVSTKWPTSEHVSRSGYTFYSWDPDNNTSDYVTKRFEVAEEMIAGSSTTITFTAEYQSNTKKRYVQYWLQNVDGNGYTVEKTYAQELYLTSNSGLSAKALYGFTHVSSMDDEVSNGTVNGVTYGIVYNFYYTRDQFSIKYMYKDATLKTTSNVYFGANINTDTYKAAPATKPDGLDSEAYFVGWYDNVACTGDPYNFSTMPGNNLVLYAKYDLPMKKVSMDLNYAGADNSVYEPIEVKKFETISSANATLPVPTREGYVFLGWYTAAEGGVKFDEAKSIETDTTVYAHWKMGDLSYTVKYLKAADNTEVYTSKTVTSSLFQIGQTYTEKAVTVEGYRVDALEKSTEPLKITGNEIIFYYTERAGVDYTVVHQYEDGTVIDTETKTADAYTERVVAYPIVVEGYYPDADAKVIESLVSDASKNVIVFTYAPYKTAEVTVNHYYQKEAGNTTDYELNESKKLEKKFLVGDSVSAKDYVKTFEQTTPYDFDHYGDVKYVVVTENHCANGIVIDIYYNIAIFDVTYSYTNAPEGAPEVPAAKEYTVGDTVTVAAEPTMKGYTFHGWTTENATVEDGKFTMPANDVAFTGNWTKNGVITVELVGKTEIYSGEEYALTEVNVTVDDAATETMTVAAFNEKFGEELTVSGGKGTNVGTYAGALQNGSEIINYNGQNYDVTYVNANLVIEKRKVTLTSATDSKTYDGTALTNSTVTAEGFVDGEGATYNVTGTQTEVGSSSNAFTYTLNENTKADNYTIETVEGTLTVTALTDEVVVTIKEKSGTATFDGEEHTVTGYEIVSISNALYTENDFSFSGDATVKGTDADTYNMELKPEDFTNNSKNITNVKFVIEDGTLVIGKKAVTITANSNAFEYDGADHSDNGYTVTGLVGEDAISAVVEGTITYPSQSPVTNVVKSHEFTAGKAANYTVSYVNGELTMTYADAVEISIIANSADKTYDGTALTADGYKLTVGKETFEVGADGVYTFANGDVLTVVVEGTVTDVDEGTVSNKIISWTIMNGTENVAEAYSVATRPGTLKINARKVTLTSESASKPYDGIELTKPVVAVTEDGFVAGEVSDIKATGAITTVGKVTNTIEVTENDSYKASNYVVTKNEGELEITTSAMALTVVSGDTEYMYNGKVQKYDVYTVTYAGTEVAANEDGSYTLPTGDSLTITSTSNVKNVSDTAAENNTFTYVLSNETSYGANFTYSFGKITIIPRTVVMTSATDEKTYDGKALTNNEVTETGNGFVTGEGATYDVTGSQLDLGFSANKFTYALNEGTLAENYAIETVEGTLTVSAIANEIVITADSNEKTYDGAPLTDAGYTFTENVLVDGDVLTAVVEGTITNVGTAANVVTGYKVMRGETDVTANYTFGKSVDGELKITKRPVTLTSATDSKTYDGKALTNSTVTAEGFVDGEGATYNVTGTQTEVGYSSNAFTYTLNENTKADNYTITTVEGTLTVTALTNEVVVTITEHSGEYTYDGTEKTVTGYDVEISNALYTEADFTFSGNATVNGTEAGTYPMELKAEDFTNNSKNITNVKFVIVDGALTIKANPVKIVITADSNSKVYDGTALTDAGYTYTGELAEDDKLVATTKGTITNVGTEVNVINTYAILDENGKDVTASYSGITTVDGELKITKRPVTITADSNAKEYDGTALTDDGWKDIAPVNVAEGDVVESVTVTGSQLDLGSSANVASNAVIKRGEEDVTANYDITYVDGTLTISAKSDEIVITADSNEKIYDGAPLTDAGYTFTENVLVEGDVLTAVVEGTITNVGTAANVVTSYKVMRGETDVTANYTFGESVDGTLTITKRPVTITADSNAKEYDGTALTDDGWKDTAPVNVAEGDVVESVTVTGSQLDLGSSANVASNAVIKRGEEDVTANYDITYVDGTLTVSAIANEIVITADSNEKIYDGAPLTDAGYTFTENVLVDGDVLTAVVEGTITDVGTAANVVTGYKVMRGETDVTANYTFGKSVDGTLTITKRAVTMTSANDEKEYDGTALTNDTVTVTGFVTGEGAQITVTGSQTKVGESKNTFEYALNEGTLAENYDITVVFGTLKVTQTTKALEIKSVSKEWMYDGKAHTNPEYVVTFGGETIAQKDGKWTLPTGDVVEITMDETATVTDVADSDTENNTFTYTLENADQYADVSTEYGDLTVIVRKVTLTSATDAREYNGNALTNDTVTVTGDGFVTGEGATYTVTGTQTLVGTSDNEFTYALNEGTLAGNYDITVVFGTLTVTDRTNPYEIEVVANSGEFKYDGAAKTVEGFETLTFVVEGNTYTVEGLTAKNTQTNAGEYVVAIEGTAVVRDVNGNDVTKQFAVTETDGKLTITKRELTMTSADASKTYDATALTNSTVTVTGEGFAEGEGAAYDVTGSQTLVGSSKNTFTYTLNEGTLADNYVIKTVFGTLTVTDEGVDHSLVINKTHPDGEYDLDDEVTFTITVKNIYAEAKKIVITEIDGVTITGEDTFENVAPGAVVTTTATWNVTEKAILAGEFVNTATATVSDKEYKANDTVNPVAPNGHLTAEKKTTSEPANGTSYALGETISYKITVTNDGNLTVKNVEVIDALVGLNETIAVMLPGDVKTFVVTYTVTEDDVLAGSVKNEVTVKGNGSDGKDPEGGDEVEDPTDEPNPHLNVVKVTTSTPVNGETYALGETITYKITVTNDGNLTITDITVTDELTEDEWTIESLIPGESKEFTAEYTVTEKDILNGKVVNVATATGDNKSDEPTKDEPGKTEDETDDIDVTLNVTKTSDADEMTGLGDTITYTITVTNEGNVPYTNLVVDDQLDGVEILPGEAYTIDENGDAVIAKLAVGETVVITAAYVVTEADLVTETEGNPVITNKVAVEGDPIPNPKDDEPVVPGGEAEVEDEILPYTLTINYWFDKVGGEIAAETVVEQHFNGQTYLVVSPVIEHYRASLIEVTGVMNGDITIDVIYTKIYHRLIVNYVYEDGTTAATAYNKRVAEGAKYNIVSPYIEGFTADIKVISGTMPGNSLEFTVTYVPDMYDVPMNIGNTTVNCGECFE